MAPAKWRTLSQKEPYKNPWWIYREDKFQLPKGEVGDYFFSSYKWIKSYHSHP